MSKSLSSALQAHLDTGATTMALCWKVTRRDGTVQGFTEHDCDLTFDSLTYIARSGFTATQVAQSLGLAVDNLNVDGAISSDTINEDDLASGRYDDADVELIWVNWADTSMRQTFSRGSIGEVKRGETAFSAEFRSLVHRLNQKTGRQYQRTCDTTVGSTACGINLSSSTYRGTGTVTSASGRNLVLSGLSGYADAWFTHGLLTFTSGLNDGLEFEVKSHTGGNVTLWDVPPGQVLSSDAFFITVGCEQLWTVCRDKFNNLVNFQGFPDIPGQDALQQYARQGEREFLGGSLRT